MALSNQTKIDKSFRTLINKEFTTTAKKFYNELGANTINISTTEVWAEDVSSTPGIAVSAGVAKQYTEFTLAPLLGYASSAFYFASGSGFTPGTSIDRVTINEDLLQRNFISDKYGADYVAVLKDNGGTVVPPTDDIDWNFDYTTGILTIQDPSEGSYTTPYKISVYQYVGKFASSSIGKSLNTASVAGSTLTFEKNDGTTFDVTLPGGSGGGIFAQTGSYFATTNDLQITGSINATSVTSSFQGDLDGKATNAGFANFAGKLTVNATGSGNLLLIGNLTASNMSASGHISASQFSGTPGTINELTSSFAISASYAVSGDITPGGSDTEIQFNSGGTILEGSPRFTFDSTGLTKLSGSFQITSSTANDIFLVKSGSIEVAKVNNDGVFVLGEMVETPTAVEGGMYYSASNFYVGVE
jgi:hypothetical protein